MGDLVYFSVDVEASGPVPGLYNLVSIGVVPIVISFHHFSSAHH